MFKDHRLNKIYDLLNEIREEMGVKTIQHHPKLMAIDDLLHDLEITDSSEVRELKEAVDDLESELTSAENTAENWESKYDNLSDRWRKNVDKVEGEVKEMLKEMFNRKEEIINIKLKELIGVTQALEALSDPTDSYIVALAKIVSCLKNE